MNLSYTAYFDESKGHDRDIIKTCTVAGAISSNDRWLRFRPEWRRIFDDPEYELPESTDFHMTDLVRGVKWGQGAFATLRGKPEAAKQLLERLCGVTRARVVHGFSFTVEQKDYDAVDSEYQLTEHFGGAYDLCVLQCAHFLKKWADRHNHEPSTIRFVIEEIPKGIGQLTHLMQRYSFWTPEPEKKKAEPLQCCDLIAWQFNNALKLVLAGATLENWPSAMGSVAKISGDYHLQSSRDMIEQNCQRIGVPRR